ncbi:MAG TPA: 4-hydroxyphenylpyruvate dioxygenase [Actinomycetota bacterium]|nr:4-hydroxyphenylpyruvate dioxygenase [Actinomycetota bacterium]
MSQRYESGSAEEAATQHDEMPLIGIDHVEYHVGNARQAAYYYTRAMGFGVTAYGGPETKVRDRASWVLEQGEARLVFTGSMGPEHPIARHVLAHGDGVHDVAFRVPDAAHAYAYATAHGATGVLEPTVFEDEHGKVVRSTIAAYGDTVHSFVERENYSGPFLPGYRAEEPIPDEGPPVGITQIDHVVCNVELGKMNEWAAFYANVLGFAQLVHFRDDQISSEYTALMSKVMWDGSGRVKLPINEPAPGKKKSQIEEYLEFYRGPGVQHIAMATDDIVGAVDALRRRGMRFIRVPATYYEAAREKVGEIEEAWADIERLNVLADRDEEGYLLQIFTKNVQDRPTVFYEVIERRGSRGFGLGNFKELFLAIEREQEERGNL